MVMSAEYKIYKKYNILLFNIRHYTLLHIVTLFNTSVITGTNSRLFSTKWGKKWVIRHLFDIYSTQIHHQLGGI